MSQKKIKVIFDTNIWISFLIGKKLQFLSALIAERKVTIVLSTELLNEIQMVTKRPKLARYFPEEKVNELVTLLNTIGEIYPIEKINTACRDKKDNFLLDLILASNAHYLITGDKDLLVLNPFNKTKIFTPAEFESIF